MKNVILMKEMHWGLDSGTVNKISKKMYVWSGDSSRSDKSEVLKSDLRVLVFMRYVMM
jgi:hypothetical protein